MEHRCSSRKHYRRPVLLACSPNNRVSADTRDVGLGGMFIETQDIALSINTPISIEFAAHNEPWRRFRLLAMVVRRTATGAGVMFLETQDDVAAALRHAFPAGSWDPADRLRTPPVATRPREAARRAVNG